MQTANQKPRSGEQGSGRSEKHKRKRLSALILDWSKCLANFHIKVKD